MGEGGYRNACSMLGGRTYRKIVTLKAEEVGGNCEDVMCVEVPLKTMTTRELPVSAHSSTLTFILLHFFVLFSSANH